MNRDAFVDEIKKRIGKPYLYGSNGPDGYDCSGLVVASLNAAGITTNDTSAQGLYILYKHKPVQRLQAPPGSLYFYGDGVHAITHVMTVIDHWNTAGIIIAGARGGDSSTISSEMAAAKRAFVYACWGDYWLDKFVAAVDPFA
jgi:cell wall-associated NlpC family hydrolase